MCKARAVIIVVGDGLSAALARELASDYALAQSAGSPEKMNAPAEETEAQKVCLDATDEAAVATLFGALPNTPRVAI